MNDRIKELALQASEKHDYNPEFAKIFAELIIKECAKCCDTYSSDILKFSQFGSNAAQDCSAIIKEHFGVKDD